MRGVDVDAANADRLWRVGELAYRTGLTVRTLHHYDAVGLLCPSGRTRSAHDSGHRLYTTKDLGRLQQILSLKQLGFGLDQIREYLERADYDPRQVVRLHLVRVRGQVAELKRLENRLAALANALEKAEVVSADEFLTTIEEMTMLEKYYTQEQLQHLEDRRKAGGELMEERIRQAPQDWANLQAEVMSAMEDKVDPGDPRAQELAKRWFELVNEFTGGDPGILQSLKKMYQNEDQIRGMDVAAMRPMMAYVTKAAAEAGITMPG
jgi:MerR family transcriptional regulator, thiopeptide resistance regulator